MSDKSAIEWTDATWNPVRGCSRVSEGCRHCYAEKIAGRFSGPGKPFELFADRAHGKARWTGRVESVEKHLRDPLRWKEPRRIFVNSMSDLFHEKLPDADLNRIFAVMSLCDWHTFQVLTKRPERMQNYLKGADLATIGDRVADLTVGWDDSAQDAALVFDWPLPNVWLGVSVENQETADERIPLLLQTPAAVRFVSYEPMLGPVDFSEWLQDGIPEPEQLDPRQTPLAMHYMRHGVPRFDWLIAGYESGPGARPAEEEWVRSAKDQCVDAGAAFFYKQSAINGRKIPTPELDGQRWMQFPAPRAAQVPA